MTEIRCETCQGTGRDHLHIWDIGPPIDYFHCETCVGYGTKTFASEYKQCYNGHIMNIALKDIEEATIGQLLQDYKHLKDRKKAIESGELKAIKASLTDMERVITRKMSDLGVRQMVDEDNTATFSLSEEIVPKVDDWDSLYHYISANGYWHLLYRKITARAYREIIQSGEAVPGCESEVVTRLSMRSKN